MNHSAVIFVVQLYLFIFIYFSPFFVTFFILNHFIKLGKMLLLIPPYLYFFIFVDSFVLFVFLFSFFSLIFFLIGLVWFMRVSK